MKTLELSELEKIQGGFWKEAFTFVGGFCAGWYAAGAVAQWLAYSNPVTGTAATVVNGVCITSALVGGYVLLNQ